MSHTTPNFDEWLQEAGPHGYEEVYALYNAAANGEDWPPYTGKESGTMTFVQKEGHYTTLKILTPKAKQKFLSMVEKRYCEGMEIGGYYYFYHSMDPNS